MRVENIRKKVWIGVCVCLAAVLICFLAACSAQPKVKSEVNVEVGGSLPVLADFLLDDVKKVEFATDPAETVNMDQLGDYEVTIRVSRKEYRSVVHVVDTIPPEVKTKDVQIFTVQELSASDLIESITDATNTTVEFVDEPSFATAGIYNVTLLVTDEGGNSVKATAQVNAVQDTEAPVIQGVKEIYTTAGGSVSYKRDVTVTDNCDAEVELVVDSSKVDLNTPGTYLVTYSAQDASGNLAQVSTSLHVERTGAELASQEIVEKKADEVLAKITKPGMTQKEVAKAIFDWVHQIAFVDTSAKDSWVQGAYNGLFNRRGDCYIYATTAKCLLTQAGIPNMLIYFERPDRIHYWNLIDLGEGWYHYDACRRADGRSFFYVSDAEILAYSRTHNGSHAYDPSKFPEIQ